MPFGTSVQRESLLAPHAGNSQAPPCCPSLPLETSSFTSFSPAVQCQHQSHEILSLLHCKGPCFCQFGHGALYAAVKWRASIKCQKEESSRAGGHPCRTGGHPCGAGPDKKQESASCRPVCSLVPDCSAVTWALGSILLEFGFFPLGDLVGVFFPFSVS